MVQEADFHELQSTKKVRQRKRPKVKLRQNRPPSDGDEDELDVCLNEKRNKRKERTRTRPALPRNDTWWEPSGKYGRRARPPPLT